MKKVSVSMALPLLIDSIEACRLLVRKLYYLYASKTSTVDLLYIVFNAYRQKGMGNDLGL